MRRRRRAAQPLAHRLESPAVCWVCPRCGSSDANAIAIASFPRRQLFETNFLNASMWDDNTWVYTTKFSLPANDSSSAYTLVFDGIKMGARVSINGLVLGEVFNQFRRYAS